MAPQTTDGRHAADIALFPLSQGEGPRIGILGDSGCGKTEAMRRLIKEYLERTDNKDPKRQSAVFIVDDKEAEAQFEGQERRDVIDFRQNPPKPKPRVVVFRGDRFDRQNGEVDPETVANIQWGMAQQERPTMVVYDELDKACNNGQWRAGDASTIRWAFTKGRNSGASSLWGTQETETVPSEAFNQSSCILAFRMVGNPVRLLGRRGYLEGNQDVGAIIAALPGDELPRSKRGFFVLLRRGRPWDEKVYRFT